MATKAHEAHVDNKQHTSSGAVQTVEKDIKPFQAFLTKFNNDWTMNLAAGLAYNLIMAMFPLVIATVAILGLIIGNLSPSAYNNLIQQITHVFQSTTSSSQNLINAALQQFAKNSGILAFIAIILAIFNGSRLFVYIEGCLDIIYHVRQRDAIPQNVVAVLMLLLFIILIPIMVVASAGPAFVFSILQNTPLALIPGIKLLFSLGGILGGLIASYILFQVIYIVVPNQNISFRHSWLGALVAAVLLEIYLALFPLYASHFLGAFSGAISILILLVFFYYFAVILYLGAEVNAFFLEKVRVTPGNLVTMVHEMTSHLPTSEEAVQQEAAASHKGEKPKVILPKTPQTSRVAEQVKKGKAPATTDAINRVPTSTQAQSHLEHDEHEEHEAKKQKSSSRGFKVSTALEAVAGTGLAFLIELFQLRHRK